MVACCRNFNLCCIATSTYICSGTNYSTCRFNRIFYICIIVMLVSCSRNCHCLSITTCNTCVKNFAVFFLASLFCYNTVIIGVSQSINNIFVFFFTANTLVQIITFSCTCRIYNFNELIVTCYMLVNFNFPNALVDIQLNLTSVCIVCIELVCNRSHCTICSINWNYIWIVKVKALIFCCLNCITVSIIDNNLNSKVFCKVIMTITPRMENTA